MTAYPVHYSVPHPARFTRIQLAVRVVAFLILGLVGLSFGTVFAVAYLGLPVVAAVRLSGGRSPEEYVQGDGATILAALRWFAAISAWAGLVTDRVPSQSPDETVQLVVDESARPRPTTSSAVWRILSGLPSGLVLALLGWIGSLVWLWAALCVLFTERVGDGAFHYLVGLQRWSIRLLAYQASLVDDYPPFSFSDSPPPPVPAARASV